ncbi:MULTISPECIES: T9SS type A sorting domain-containing protein [unclassified Polaribacter]|uniref:T9SS type A sorting domain-containing protein n=1 Tax=unclassified Polaribacter TaxID=196858 RepID=UPI0011BF3B48|nr:MULTISPECIES: T9SS type A sorting domain-containing protein [unclassified Polaribacter]TXD51130.1 T9SS type A sorting domain-containing protein [Polaribacter sp. IC063]TXD58191.1 T9SS type A sorting domain-containing protein [Polaribacter sp. IC066]
MQNIKDTYNWTIADDGLNCKTVIDKIKVYPSPAKQYISLEESEVSVSASIYNSRGQKVTTAKSTNKIAIENLPSGVYTIRISDGESQSYKRFVKL